MLVIAGGSNDQGVVAVFDAASLAVVATNQQFPGRAHAVLTHENGLFVGCRNSSDLLKLNTKDLSTLQRIDVGAAGVTAISLSPDRPQIVYAVRKPQKQSQSAEVIAWDLQQREVNHRFGVQSDTVRSISCSPDGRLIAAGLSNSGGLLVFDNRLTLQRQTIAHATSVSDIGFTNDGQRLVSAGGDGAVHVWSVSRLLAPDQAITWVDKQLAFATDGIFMGNDMACVTCRGNGELVYWNTNTGAIVARHDLGSKHASVCFSADRSFKAVANEALPGIEISKSKMTCPTLEITNVSTGETVLKHKFAQKGSRTIRRAFSRDNQLYVHALQSKLFVFDVTQQSILHEREISARIRAIDFSIDNRTCVVADMSGTLHQYSVPDFERIRTVPGDREMLIGIAHSPDGEHLAAVGFDRRVNLFHAKTLASMRASHRFHTTTRYLTDVAYSPDGKRIASGSPDGTIRLWHADTGEELLSFSTVGNYYPDVEFSASGEKLLVTSGDESFVVHAAHRSALSKLTVSEMKDIACRNVVASSRTIQATEPKWLFHPTNNSHSIQGAQMRTQVVPHIHRAVVTIATGFLAVVSAIPAYCQTPFFWMTSTATICTRLRSLGTKILLRKKN